MPATGWTTSSSRSSVSPLPPSPPPAASPRRLRSRKRRPRRPWRPLVVVVVVVLRTAIAGPAVALLVTAVLLAVRLGVLLVLVLVGVLLRDSRRPWRSGRLSCLLSLAGVACVAGGAAALATLLALAARRSDVVGRGVGRVRRRAPTRCRRRRTRRPCRPVVGASEVLSSIPPRLSRIAAMSSPLRIPEAPLTPTELARARSSGSTMLDSDPAEASVVTSALGAGRGRRGDRRVSGREEMRILSSRCSAVQPVRRCRQP